MRARRMYLVDAIHKPFLTDALRKIEVAKLNGDTIVALTRMELYAYIEAVKMPVVAEDHHEILERFIKYCSDFADYLKEYKSEDPSCQISNLTCIVELAQDFTDNVKREINLSDIYDIHHLRKIRRASRQDEYIELYGVQK